MRRLKSVFVLLKSILFFSFRLFLVMRPCCGITATSICVPIGALLIFIMSFGCAGWFDWTQRTCAVSNCEEINIENSLAARVFIGVAVIINDQLTPLTNYYDISGGSCKNIGSTDTCYTSGNYLSHTRMPNLWYLWIISFLPFLIVIIIRNITVSILFIIPHNYLIHF